MKWILAAAKRLARTLADLLLVIVGSPVRVGFAPGYSIDECELDAPYSEAARAERSKEMARGHSLAQVFTFEIEGLLHGNGGISRQ
jgi:hypothetical protein